MRITINDIARISGFSKTSVSFAFNDPSRISQKTRDRILQVAEEVGYVPDPVARNLSTRRIGTIGFLLPHVINKSLLNPYFNEIILGVGQVCNTQEFSLTLVPPLRGVIDNGVRAAAVDGFITLGLHPDMKVVQLIQQRHMPYVTIDGFPSESVHSVNINDTESAYEAMSYILEQGHRRIAIVGLESSGVGEDEERIGVEAWRLAGHEQALQKYGLRLGNEVKKVDTETSMEGGKRAVQRLFVGQKSQWPSALVCLSDIAAIGAILELRQRGIRVPEDVSVLGFDDIPEASLIAPNLTTIHQPGREKGIRAAEMLFSILQNKTVEMHVEFAARLVVRQSVNPFVA